MTGHQDGDNGVKVAVTPAMIRPKEWGLVLTPR